jgi:hypothetical protein
VDAHVDRHALDRDGEIGAVVEIEAAQEVLIGLSLAAVPRDDQARRGFEQFARPGRRIGGDPLRRDLLLLAAMGG